MLADAHVYEPTLALCCCRYWQVHCGVGVRMLLRGQEITGRQHCWNQLSALVRSNYLHFI